MKPELSVEEKQKHSFNLKKSSNYFYEIAAGLDEYSAAFIQVLSKLNEKDCARAVKNLEKLRRRVFKHAGLLKQLHKKSTNSIIGLQKGIHALKHKLITANTEINLNEWDGVVVTISNKWSYYFYFKSPSSKEDKEYYKVTLGEWQKQSGQNPEFFLFKQDKYPYTKGPQLSKQQFDKLISLF